MLRSVRAMGMYTTKNQDSANESAWSGTASTLTKTSHRPWPSVPPTPSMLSETAGASRCARIE